MALIQHQDCILALSAQGPRTSSCQAHKNNAGLCAEQNIRPPSVRRPLSLETSLLSRALFRLLCRLSYTIKTCPHLINFVLLRSPGLFITRNNKHGIADYCKGNDKQQLQYMDCKAC